MKKATNIVILFLFGLGSLVAMGLVAGVTNGRSTGVHPAAGPGSGPIGGLIVGARSSLMVAHDSLGAGARQDASYALDAAIRAAEVGAYATSGVVGAAFRAALDEARTAARDLQNGRGDAALSHVGAAMERLGDHAFELEAGRQPGPPGTDYRGATLINLAGVRVGELQDLTTQTAQVSGRR